MEAPGGTGADVMSSRATPVEPGPSTRACAEAGPGSLPSRCAVGQRALAPGLHHSCLWAVWGTGSPPSPAAAARPSTTRFLPILDLLEVLSDVDEMSRRRPEILGFFSVRELPCARRNWDTCQRLGREGKGTLGPEQGRRPHPPSCWPPSSARSGWALGRVPRLTAALSQMLSPAQN